MSPVYRLGIDIGVNSLGWCAFKLDPSGEPAGILDLGVRLFADGRDPKRGTSLAVDRRVARSMRRRRDRYLLRRSDLMEALIRHGLMPKDAAERKKLEHFDPYESRAKGLDDKLPLHHFGRAIFHLNQRRGFKSNRKADKGKDDDKGKIKSAVSRLRKAMGETGARTLGEYLYRRHIERKPVRARLRGEGAKAEYELYPQRAMLEAEFDLLWAAQKKFHPDIKEEARAEIRNILFRQRPLRPVDPGKCVLDPSDPRALAALPVAQDFRIWQELANLKIVAPDLSSRVLTKEQRDKLYAELERRPKVAFDRMRRVLKLDTSTRFNLESEKRDDLLGHKTNVEMAKDTRFGKAWWSLDDARRSEIVETLLEEVDKDKLLLIAEDEWGLSPEAAQAVVDAPLPDGYARLGREALAKIVRIIRDQGLTYAEAVKQAYPDANVQPEREKELPYYGKALERHVAFGSGEPTASDEKRYGRIANPTVHIGLNQLRRLINACIARHGAPSQIVVEVARELKLSRKQKEEIEKDQAGNQKKNDDRRAKLTKLGLPDSGENRMRLRLWEELSKEPHDRKCVYTGVQISPTMLFDGQVDIDHIIPFRLCLDDGAANKIVCLARANRQKARQTPFEAFGHTPEWPTILGRAESLPKNKRWRFAPDALDRLKLEYREGLPAEVVADMELGQGFLARHLTDTQYLARLTREYLSHVCDPNRVWVIPGRLTAMLRGKWGLNSLLSDSNLKNRADHRHHAIDAAVVGLTDRALLQKIARANEESRQRLIDDMPEPWEGFRDELRDRLQGTIVSVRSDHGKGGRLHEETAYGLVKDPAAEDGHNLAFRKAFVGLNENEIERIRDRNLRARVRACVAAAEKESGDKLSAAQLKQALARFSGTDDLFKGIRHVRLLKVEEGFISIRDKRTGDVYKALVPGENHHLDIFEQPDGKWIGAPVTMFQANQQLSLDEKSKGHPAAKRIMRLHKGDFLKLEHEGRERVMRVVQLWEKLLVLADHYEGGDLDEREKAAKKGEDYFKWLRPSFNTLRKYKARKVRIDTLGRVHDPGPPAGNGK
jgi:CRISPR-associated endonuclease Csn1